MTGCLLDIFGLEIFLILHHEFLLLKLSMKNFEIFFMNIIMFIESHQHPLVENS